MPVKVTSTTNPVNAEISAADLQSMKQNFISQVDVYPSTGRGKIIKKYSVAVMKDELKNLIEHYESNGGIDVININLAVHSDTFVSCNGKNDGDSLTVVIEAGKFRDPLNTHLGFIPFNNADEFVVIPGYHGVVAPVNGLADLGPVPVAAQPVGPCCPSSNP